MYQETHTHKYFYSPNHYYSLICDPNDANLKGHELVSNETISIVGLFFNIY